MKNEDFNKMAVEILELVGGEDNVAHFLHCMTRLRIKPKSRDTVDIKAIEKLPYVIQVLEISGVVQIVLGPNRVNEVYDEFSKLVKKSAEYVDENLDDQPLGMKLISALQAIVLPAVGVLAGVALINALVTILGLAGVSTDAAFMSILKILGSIVTGYLGVYLAFNTSKYFGGNPFIGITLALFIYSPNLNGIEFMGISLYQGIGGIIGIIAMAIIAAKIEVKLKTIIKKELQMILLPFLTIVITLIPTLFIIIPISAELTEWLTSVVSYVLYSNQVVFVMANAILAAMWGLLVMSGLHMSVMAAILPIAMETGIAPLQVNFVMLAAALIGLTLAVIRKEKDDPVVREIGIGGMITASTGITEPLLYGIALPRFKTIFYVMAGSFMGGLINGLANIETFFPASSGIFMTLTLVDIQDKWYLFLLSWFVAGAIPFVLYTLFPVKIKK